MEPTQFSDAENSASNPDRKQPSPSQPVIEGPWMAECHALQLLHLGGVLNVFSSEAATNQERVHGIGSAVRDEAYATDSEAVSRKLVTEMSN